MKAENRQKLLIWAVVVLAVMNLSTIVTILYHTSQAKKAASIPVPDQRQQEANAERFSGRFFCDQLGFNPDQMNKFREFNPVFRQQARSITLELSGLRRQMQLEMASANSDTGRLNRLSDSIGQLHGDLKKLTYRYYLDMKGICNPQQQNELEQLFTVLFASDAGLGFPGGRGLKGRQHGKRLNN